MAELLLILMGIAIVICLLAAVWDSNRFVTVTYEIPSDRVTKPCRFVLLADLHNKSFGRDQERLMGKIDEISPDAVLVAGDMLTAIKGHPFDKALSLCGSCPGGIRSITAWEITNRG